jgi:hypothetical protein
MANFTFSGLVPHAIFNELDSQGLFLGLPRISEERNPAYKARLLDVFVNRSSSTQQGLIHGITRELGLAVSEVMTVKNVLDGNGDPVLPFPATVFEETKCTLYSDFGEGTVLKTIDRFETSGIAWTLTELAAEINATGSFTATLDPDAIGNQRSMTIFNQSSVKFSLNEYISGKGHRIKLEHENIVLDSITVVSDNVLRRVDAEVDLVYPGDYTIDRKAGFLITNVIPMSGSRIRYQYREDTMIFKASPVIMHNIQSADFQTKMYEQEIDEDGNTINGTPTILGADIVNELLSVFPSNWGL